MMNERKKEATEKFWNETIPDFQVYVSDLTKEELENTRDNNLKRKLRELIEDFKILKTNKKIRDLAGIYLEHELFPERYFEDALHVAIATFYEISYLVSWNFEHLVKVKTRRLVNSVNTLTGYKEIEIVSPQEL